MRGDKRYDRSRDPELPPLPRSQHTPFPGAGQDCLSSANSEEMLPLPALLLQGLRGGVGASVPCGPWLIEFTSLGGHVGNSLVCLRELVILADAQNNSCLSGGVEGAHTGRQFLFQAQAQVRRALR